MERILEIDSLKYLIYSFGNVEHRKRMKKVCVEVCVCVEFETEHILNEFWYERRNNGGMMEPLEAFLARRCSLTYRKEAFDGYSACRCCSRHSHYKPKVSSINDGIFRYELNELNEKPEMNHVPESTDKHDCECSCRHLSRAFYRIKDYPEYYDDQSR